VQWLLARIMREEVSAQIGLTYVCARLCAGVDRDDDAGFECQTPDRQ